MSLPIVLTVNCDDEPVYAYETGDFTVYDPYTSECGRFTVDPMEVYGITPMQAEGLHALNVAHGFKDRF